MALATSYYTLDGEILAESSGGNRLDYLRDALGSVTGKCNNSAVSASSARYKPYGDLLTGSTYKYGWVGMYGYRAAPNGCYVKARHLSTGLGVWTTVDPLWPDELPFGYVGMRVTVSTDYSGLSCKITANPNDAWHETTKCLAVCVYLGVLGSCCGFHFRELAYINWSAKNCKKPCGVYQWFKDIDHPNWTKDNDDGFYGWPLGTNHPYPTKPFNDNPEHEGYRNECVSFTEEIQYVTCVCCADGSACWPRETTWTTIQCSLPSCEPKTKANLKRMTASEEKSWCERARNE